jgi:CheY-like chemotaxis protein
MVDQTTFERYVQNALEHLYDPAYLLSHPLAALVRVDAAPEAPGQALYQVLRDALGQLKPPIGAPHHSPAWRSYRYLLLRYVEMLTIGQVADELGISPRQCRRDHPEAIHAISAILWERYGRRAPRAPGQGRPDRNAEAGSGLLETELGKLGAAPGIGASVEAVVESVSATLASLAEKKSCRLLVAGSLSVPPVQVDRTVFRQILVELLLFAFDRGAGGDVRVGADRRGEAVVVEIQVSPPTRLRSAPEDPSGETRIAVSRRLAILQGGSLRVEARDDRTAILLELPIVAVPTILVVDDNTDVSQLFRRYLSGRYDVQVAATGEQATSIARQVQPVVITLDVMMPGQDGWEVLQILKHDPVTAPIPIVVCSVLRERELALSLGAADFLAKPIMEPELLAALERCRTRPGSGSDLAEITGVL